jgi:ATP-binding cassette subfamily C protein
VTDATAATLTDSTSKRMRAKTSARKLYEIFTPRERIQALILFVGSLLAAFAQTAGVAVIFPFINVAMNPNVIQENRWLHALYLRGGFTDADSFMIFLGSAVFTTIILSSIAPAFVAWAKARFLLNKDHALSTRLLTLYLSRPYQYFLGKNTSELGKNVLNEVGGLIMNMLMAIFELFIQGGLLLVLVTMLLVVNIRVTLAAMLLLGGSYAFLSLIIKSALQKRGALRLEANTNRYRFATEALSGIKTTRVMGIEPYFISNYSTNSLNYALHTRFALVSGELPRYFLEAVAFGGIVFFLVSRLAAGGQISDLLPLVSLYAFATYRMMPALHRVYHSVNQLHYYRAILDKIHTDMTEDDMPSEASADDTSLPFDRAIRLQDIDFRYADAQTDVINGLDITIPKNTSVGFVGATGSGKTTLVDIILGLLVPQQGRMLVDDTPITEKNVRAWRRKIGYVPQEIYLSDDSIRKNIAFGVSGDEIDDDRVREATSIAALDDFIQTLPDKYDTVIGERGVRLSGGQRQRIGLARALYRNPEVLVLDEATSSLDGATEEAVLNAVRSASKARTVIMIAHRLNTLKDCDVIYIMENGRFAANGTYDELLHSNKTFMRMAKVGNA